MPHKLALSLALSLALVALRGASAHADDDADRRDAANIDDNYQAAEAEGPQRTTTPQKWNQVDLKLLTLSVGGGVLLDWVTYEQSAASQAQMPVSADGKLRDFRFLFKGKLTFAPRISYTLGYMYDGPTGTWRFRQTGIMVDVKELGGQLFIGRTKEGFSTNKLMVGYSGWTMERCTANEAFLPILADGIKWTGHVPGNKLVYNVGWFIDTLSEDESFNKNDKQFIGRVVFLPFAGSKSRTLLHLAAETRFAASNDGMLQYRSRPEAFPAQSYAVDTGTFPAASWTTYGFEAYYRPGPFLFGSEYFINTVSSAETGNPVFHGGEALVAYLFTGEVRPYNERGGFFESISPRRAVSAGGVGAWELVVRGSYIDLDSGTIAGGRFWRITPQVNWFLSDNLRLELAYGYSMLDRGGMSESTQYVQSRLQLTLM